MGSIFHVAPTRWERDHAGALISGVHYAELHDGSLPNNPFWRDLEFRYHRDAHAFSIVHPNAKLILDHYFAHEVHQPVVDRCHDGQPIWGRMRHAICVPATPLPPLPPPCIPVTPPPPQQGAQTVPEPAASTMLAMAFVLVGAWWFMTKQKG